MIMRAGKACLEKFQITLAFAILLLLMSGVAALGDENIIRSLYTTPESGSLGVGFNSVKSEFITDNICVNFKNTVAKAAGGVGNSTYSCFVDSKKELEDKFLYNFNPGAAASISDFTTAKSKVTQTILDNTNFSTDKITLIAYWRQEDKKIYSNELPSLTEEGFAVLNADRKKFFQLYGNQYVSAITLGKIFYIVYQADISKYTNYSIRTKNAIRRALEMSLKKVMGGKLTADESSFVAEKLENIQISSMTYGNNIPDFTGPYSADDFRGIIRAVGATASDAISWELKSYVNTENWKDSLLYDSSDYFRMAQEWKSHLSYLNYIIANSRLNYDIYSDCKAAKEIIGNQLKLVYALDSDARIPTGKELSAFYGLYNRYLSKMQINPRAYTMQTPNNQLNVDLNALEDVETVKIEFSYALKTGFSFQNLFGGNKNKAASVILYVVDEDGNLSEMVSFPLAKEGTIVLYDGIKFSDKFKIGFSDAKLNLDKSQIICSFTEKTHDVIWRLLYNKNRGDVMKNPSGNHPG